MGNEFYVENVVFWVMFDEVDVLWCVDGSLLLVDVMCGGLGVIWLVGVGVEWFVVIENV